MKARPGIYGRAPIELLAEPSLTMPMLRAYIAVSSFQGGADDCWPSRDQICQRASQSAGVTSRAISSLVSLGWMIRIRQGSGKTNRYEALIEVRAVSTSDSSGMPAVSTKEVRAVSTSDSIQNASDDGKDPATLPLFESEKNNLKEQLSPKKNNSAISPPKGASIAKGTFDHLKQWFSETHFSLRGEKPYMNGRDYRALSNMLKKNGKTVDEIKEKAEALVEKTKVEKHPFWRDAPIVPWFVELKWNEIIVSDYYNPDETAEEELARIEGRR